MFYNSQCVSFLFLNSEDSVTDIYSKGHVAFGEFPYCSEDAKPRSPNLVLTNPLLTSMLFDFYDSIIQSFLCK